MTPTAIIASAIGVVFVCVPAPFDLAAGCEGVVGLSVLIAWLISVASMPNAAEVADALRDMESVESGWSAGTSCALVVAPADRPPDDERSAGLVERATVDPLEVERGAVGVVLGVVLGVGDGDVLVAAVVVSVVVTVADVVSVANAADAVEPAAGDTLKIDNTKARIPAIPAVIPASTPNPARAPTPLGATRRL